MSVTKTKQHYWRIRSAIRAGFANQVRSLSAYMRARGLPGRGRASINPCEAKSILILAWLFPPLITGGIYRPLALARFAALNGWQVTVQAGPFPDHVTVAGESLLKKLPSSVRLIRQRTADPTLHPALLPRIDGGILNSIAGFESAVEQLTAFPPEFIVASGPPFQGFLAAKWLADHFGSKLVLDYRDEWTECPFDFVDKAGANRAIERECVVRADRIIFTTDSHRCNALRVFPGITREKVSVVPNGYDPEDVVYSEQSEPSESIGNCLTLAFLGNLGDHTLPERFLECLTDAVDRNCELNKRVRVRFIGTRSRLADRQLANFKYHDMISVEDQIRKSEAIRVMSKSDALLIFNSNPFERYIPGKLYDYLAAGTPIILFGRGGECGNIVRETGAGIEVDATVDGLADAVTRIGAGFRVNSSRVELFLARRTREATSMQFLQALLDLSAK